MGDCPACSRRRERSDAVHVVAFPKKARLRVDNYFGGCPECGGDDGYLNVNRDHWFVCDKHKTKWWAGYNLFSSWQEESEAEWLSNSYRLAEYREVQPLPCTDPDIGGAA
jgi:hypothetical protein